MDQRWSYINTPNGVPYIYQSVVDVFRSYAKKLPNKEILIHREPDGFRNTLTYLQLIEKSEQLAKYLINRGIHQGDAVGILGPNSCEWMVGELGILMAGATVIHLQAGMTSAADNKEIMEIVDCKGIIVNQGRDGDFLPAIEKLVSVMDSVWKGKGIVVYLQDFKNRDSVCLYTILSKELNEDVSKIKIRPEDTAYIFSTSGSTGKPKLVAKSHFAEANVPGTFMIDEDQLSAKAYCDRPFGWAAGNPSGFLLVGCAHVFCSTSLAVKGKNTKEVWDIIEAEKCTQARLLPYHLFDMLKFKREMGNYQRPYKLKNICVTGQIVPDNILPVIGTFTDSITVWYGSTEMYGVATEHYMKANLRFEMGKVGKPVVGYEIKLADEEEDTVPFGEIGEVYVRSRLAFNGYYGNDRKTKDAVRQGGWIKTGDLAMFDLLGKIIIKGRKVDVISRGTRKIFPASIELVVSDMAGIQMAIVVGVPDDRLMEEVCVCYTTEHASSISPNDVRKFCQRQFYVEGTTDDGLGLMPQYFLRFPEFPRLPNGKINRLKIKAMAAKQVNHQED